MGSGGVPSGGVTVVMYENRSEGLPVNGKPNSRTDLYVGGIKKQSRWYDWKGRAVRNRDYIGPFEKNVDFPHDHEWKWENDKPFRISKHLAPDFINYKESGNEKK